MSRPLDAHINESDEAYVQARLIGQAVGHRRASMKIAKVQLAAVETYFGRQVVSQLGFRVRLGQVMQTAARAAWRDYDAAFWNARRVAGQHVVRGVARETVLAAILTAHPMLLPEHAGQVADEEAAWWIRWRHDRDLAA